MPSRVSNDTKTFKFSAGPPWHGSSVCSADGTNCGATPRSILFLFQPPLPYLNEWAVGLLRIRSGHDTAWWRGQTPGHTARALTVRHLPQKQGWPALHRQYPRRKLLIVWLTLLQRGLVLMSNFPFGRLITSVYFISSSITYPTSCIIHFLLGN